MTKQDDPAKCISNKPDRNSSLKRSTKAPLIGCATGGCLFPILLFVFAAISGDMGGPLFWPIAVIFLGALGTVIGAIYVFTKSIPNTRKTELNQIQIKKETEQGGDGDAEEAI